MKTGIIDNPDGAPSGILGKVRSLMPELMVLTPKEPHAFPLKPNPVAWLESYWNKKPLAVNQAARPLIRRITSEAQLNKVPRRRR